MKNPPKDSRMMSVDEKGYDGLLTGVSELLEQARHAAARSVNQILTATYWEIGRRIVDFEQRGARRAEYGVSLLQRLAKDLSARFGRGFGYSNLNLFRQVYLTYRDRHPILQSVTGESLISLNTPVHRSPHQEFMLSWTHYVRLLPLEEQAKRFCTPYASR
jgi:hypothetical protein